VSRIQIQTTCLFRKGKDQLFLLFGSSLHANSFFLIASTTVTGFLGFAFWVGAARLYNTEAVGVGSAVIAAGNQLAMLSGVGFDAALLRFLPERREQAQLLINSVLTLTMLAGITTAAIFFVGIPVWSPALNTIYEQPIYGLVFVALIPGLLLITMANSSFIGSRKSSFALMTNIISSILRIAMLCGFAVFSGSIGIIGAWSVSAWITFLIAAFILLPRIFPGYKPLPRFGISVVRPLVLYSTQNYLALLLFNAQMYVVPLIVLNLVGPEANAYYFSAVALSSPGWVIPLAVSLVVVVEGVHDASKLALTLKKGLILAAALIAPILLILWFGGGTLLLVFGERYSQEGLQPLRLLAIAGLPVVLIDFYIAIRRVQQRMNGPVALMILVSTGSLLGTYFLTPLLGISGAALAILVANSVGALWAILQLIPMLRKGGGVNKEAQLT
jgi:O-antigen/teichoic acid export membrane protein